MKPGSFVKLTWLELKLFLREPLAVLFTLAFPLVFMFVIAGVFNAPQGPNSPFLGVGGAEYYVVSNIGIVIGAMGLIALPVHMAAYLERGIIRRFRASSVPVAAVVLAQAIVSLIVAIVATALLLVAARPAYTYHFPSSLPGVVLGFVVGLISFLAIGTLIAGVSRSTRSAQGISFIAFFPHAPPGRFPAARLRGAGAAGPLVWTRDIGKGPGDPGRNCHGGSGWVSRPLPATLSCRRMSARRAWSPSGSDRNLRL